MDPQARRLGSLTALAVAMAVAFPAAADEAAPTRFEMSAIIDASKVFHGGVNTHGGALRHLFDANLTLDGEHHFGIPRSTVFFDFQNQSGEDGSDDTGDLQAYSNIDEADFTALYEVWFEQTSEDGRWRLKIGKVDANSEFAYVDNGAEFIHSSPGFSPSIFVFPTYPDPATSVNLFFDPVEDFGVALGVYDGAAQEGFRTGRRGPKTFLGSPSDLFVVGEAIWRWGDGSRLALGYWGHTGTFAQFDGGTSDGATGGYLTLDLPLAPKLGGFVQFAWADEQLSGVQRHVGLGMQREAPLPGRPDDACGIMVSWAQLSDEPGAGFSAHHETATEVFYKIHICENLQLKPDLQYIANPGGGGVKDALVGTLRVEVSY